jgi:3-dehydroquinate dehydratase-2
MSKPVVLVVSGPNLNLLGQRQPDVYGRATLEDHLDRARAAAARLGLVVEHLQSNHEGDLIEAVHGARGRAAALVVNAGALTHTSWSLHDALAAFDGVVIELHLSNPAAREPFRHTSVVAPVAHGSIAGFGGLGYELAVEAVARLLAGGEGGPPTGSGAAGEASAADGRTPPGAGAPTEKGTRT